MRVWRICKASYAAAAFNGEGTLLFAGRWNPAGVRMVYTSTSLALAAEELFVHLDPTSAPRDLVSIRANIPDGIALERIEVSGLSAGWRTLGRVDLQSVGAAWISSSRSVALEVPSAAIAGEWNVLLNPAHPEFSKIRIDPPQPFIFDPRMFK
jgi:RES domain-containing protein